MDARSFRRRSIVSFVGIFFGQSIGFLSYLLIGLFRNNALPVGWVGVAVIWYSVGVVVFLGARIAIPYVDPVILPIVFALTGLGLAMIHRIDLAFPDDRADMPSQFIAVVVGVVALLVIIFFLKDPRRLKGFPYLLALLGCFLLLLPLVPGLGREINGARIWIGLGPFSFQPAEVAKLVLAASFAAYLADNKEVLAGAGRKVLGVELPRLRDLGPVALVWGVSVLVMVTQTDFGTALLFFGLFLAMVYVATGKGSWVIVGLGLFLAAGTVAVQFTSHIQRRIDYWLRPFDFPPGSDPYHDATQIIQAQFGMSSGGLIGTGWGLGRPTLVPFASSDMIATSLAEEIGIVGLMAIIILYGLLAFRGLKAALMATEPFLKLFGAGLSFVFLLQSFIVIGGATRLLPLTGLITPFLSQGGSAMMVNWMLVALILVISHQTRRPVIELDPTSTAGVTGLEDEATQEISVKVLAQIGSGVIQPVQQINGEQIRLGTDGAPLVKPSEVYQISYRSPEPVSEAAALGVARHHDEDTYFGRGTD
ncbi:MAG: FtsW/RodA/SpoVE family cell cycle protein [Propionibacteriaceae bacterium]|nr:FtsW/RodA/SpoVE family cell cycle protein [Propionibacteriaceae bacterium]